MSDSGNEDNNNNYNENNEIYDDNEDYNPENDGGEYGNQNNNYENQDGENYDENYDNDQHGNEYDDGQEGQPQGEEEENDYNYGNDLINGQNREEEEEEEDDFPEYANEQNKQLNEIIKEKRRLIKEISRKIDEKQDRKKILGDHLKSVQVELLHTQALIDEKNKEIETEDHLKQISERQIGRLQAEYRKMKKLAMEQEEKLNDVQNQIYKGNEKMDQYKLQMNCDQEELEQWSLAARQKEEDNLTLEKYKRADEVKIKELNLLITRLTVKNILSFNLNILLQKIQLNTFIQQAEVSKKQQELEKEITETQTAQIELDKTSEEFNKQNEERHKLFLQWKEVTEIIKRRHENIREAGEEFSKVKMEMGTNQDALKQRKQMLKSEKDNNKAIEQANELLERQKIQQIKDNKVVKEQNDNLMAEVEILKNQVSAFASDLNSKKNKISMLTQDKLAKKQRLNLAQQKYNAHVIKMKNEDMAAKNFEAQKAYAEEKYTTKLKEKQAIEKKIKKKKESLYRYTQELFKLREKEANLYGDIQGNMAACRNLKAHISNLNQDFQRQQELLYNAEYQIQLMERKVARAKGERTLEERNDIKNEKEKAQNENDEVKSENKKLKDSLKDLEDSLRSIDKRLTALQGDEKKYDKIVKSLILENDMTYQDLNKIVKKKEEILVNHDSMKLEIKKIQQTLSNEMNTVFQLENRKYQLEMSMQEREKEIMVHKDVLITENKAAEEERHKIAVELAERKTKVKNLKIKYESLVQKNVASNGEVETVNEHSQAYYVIKAAQEREELQRKGDELNAKILKSEKELKALDNTLNHLKGWNSKYWDSFLNKGVTKNDRDQKEALDDQCRAGSENLFKKKKELQKLQKEYEEDMRRFNEIQNKMEILANQERDLSEQIDRVQKDIQEQQGKIERANKNFEKTAKRTEQLGINTSEDNIHIVQMLYDRETNLAKTLLTAIYNLSNDIPEMAGVLEDALRENNIALPSRAPSSIDTQSQAASQRSFNSRGSYKSQQSGQQSRQSRQSSRSRQY
ncbi:hypothetical protein PPERSA_11980 [Pseudocohnilembus persalinus]|uniref:Uncharacterized protein n=1 Tax=Pseudocohnilembus persalinus TaxID=266149 RepID=A0A0V0QKT2_PSEPJ|nr:hypothetical protein PPERSA_11980 [Pseudocohnilembus persalinus]|eukprot:KRX02640.1 hypothetical protein PPERSA_11980 [Pseudocohnilembus persalinus]